MTFEVRPAEEASPADILSVIESAFDRPRGMDWYRWKHEDGPWGPSVGVVAVDGAKVIGVRLLLPWQFATKNGTPVLVHRAVEAATAPEAARRGVFSALNAALMEQFDPVFSTPNELSRPGYEKLGWTTREVAQHHYWPVLPGPTGGVSVAPTCETDLGVDVHAGRLQTAWEPRSLAWRFDPRSGERYTAAISETEQGPGGVVYRRFDRKGARVLLLLHRWGHQRSWRRALRAVATTERAAFVLSTSATKRLGLRRNHSLVTMWSKTSGVTLEGWHPDFVDLERVL